MSSQPIWLTTEYIQKFLLASFKDEELKIKNFEVSPGSSAGDGYLSTIFRIKISTNKKPISIIAKVLLTGTSADTIQGSFNVYDKEKLVLETLLPKTLSKLSNPNLFFAKFYYADDVYRTLFLEDLCEDGFQLCDHDSNGLDLQHSLLVIETLAKLHGTSYLVFKEEASLAKNFEKYFYCEENRKLLENWTMNAHRGIMEIIDEWKLPEEYKKKLRNADDWVSRMIKTWERTDDQINVLVQTDCWVNNLMFKYNKNGVEAVKMVDFQLASYHSLTLDLAGFIFTSTSIDVKTNHLNTLMDHYYDHFTGITGSIENFSKEKLWKEFHERLFIGFITLICFSPVVMAPSKTKAIDTDAIANGEDISSNTQIYKNSKFLDCVEKLMPYFVQHNVI